MKVWGIFATMLLILSLCLNVWYYSETTSLNANISQLAGHSYFSGYQLPPETMSEIRSNTGEIVYANQEMQRDILKVIASNQELENEVYRLENENQEYRYTLEQIRKEAEEAEKYGMWEKLIKIILGYGF